MDVSAKYLLQFSQTEGVSLSKQNGDHLYSYKKEGAETEPDEPSLSYFFSNLASKAVFDLLANASERGSDQEKSLLFHSHGKALSRVNELYPLTHDFLTATGKAGGPRIEYTPSIWFDKSLSLKEDFKTALETYRSKIYIQDFETEDIRSYVNEWIRINTKGLITDALEISDVRADTRLILATTLDFEGKWSVPFQDAGEKDFTLITREVIKMPFMTSTAKQFVQQFQGYKLLSIPFEQYPASRFSMLFYLPDAIENTASLRDFVGLHESVIQDVYFPEEQVEVGEFFIPKFKLNTTTFFDLGRTLDLKEVVDSRSLFTSTGRLRGSLEINETGARAAGATAFSSEINPPEPSGGGEASVPASSMSIDFVANRPFIFFIRDNRFGRMLFAGGLIDTDTSGNRP